GDALARVGDAVDTLEGKAGRLDELADNANETLTEIRTAARGVGRLTDAAGGAPVVGGFVEDPPKIPDRADGEGNRKVFAETDLFPAGLAQLTTQGKQRLGDIGSWLSGLSRHEGAEVVVVAYADPKGAKADPARQLTQKQSEAVAYYLKKQGSVYKDDYLLSEKL